MRFPWVILPKALVLQDECFGKNYLSFQDFSGNHGWTSGIFVPWLENLFLTSYKKEGCLIQDECFALKNLSFLDFTRNHERTSGIFVPWLENLFLTSYRKEGCLISMMKPPMFSVYKRPSVPRKTCQMTPRLTGITPTSPQQSRLAMPVQGCTVKLNQ